MTAKLLTGASPRMTELLIEKYTAHTDASDILDGLSAEQAATKRPGWPYSIAEQVAHMLFWQRHMQGHIETGSSPEVPTAADGWPAVPPGDWEKVRGEFLAALQKNREIARNPDLLNRRYDPEANYTVGAKLLSMVTHDSYHLGQIALLRRLLGAWPPPNGGDTW